MCKGLDENTKIRGEKNSDSFRRIISIRKFGGHKTQMNALETIGKSSYFAKVQDTEQ